MTMQTTTLLLVSLLVALPILLFFAGTRIGARRSTRPLRSLVSAMRRIAAGEYGAELPIQEEGEVGRLAREVGAMQQEVQEREAALHHLAFFDDLTGLPNRNQFRIDLSDQIEEARHRGGRVAVAMVDFDRFKEINDSLGHYLGDRLLAGIASQLEVAAEDKQIKVARLGGDEFGLLFHVGSINEAREGVEDLRQVLSGALEIDDLRIDIDTNVGITVFPDQGGDAETLMQQAEVAMYVAKERRLGLTFYETSQNRHSIQRLA